MAQSTTTISSGRPPWPVVAFIPLVAAWNLIGYFVLNRPPQDLLNVLYGLVLPIAMSIGLWRGARGAWWVAVASAALAVVFGAATVWTGERDLAVVQLVGGLTLLLLLTHDSTRRWCGFRS
ncbi:MAG: hypothetical protein M3N53_13035 [Actinomycetota bacterium]|nr:hypothetical protein [Actinomycetota bacterium]